MSWAQDGHFMIFFCARKVRLPSHVLCLIKDWPANAPSRHSLQKLWAHGVVRGRVITFLHIRQLNSANFRKQFIIIEIFCKLVNTIKTHLQFLQLSSFNLNGGGCKKKYTFQKPFFHWQFFVTSNSHGTIIIQFTLNLNPTFWWSFFPQPATLFLLWDKIKLQINLKKLTLSILKCCKL